MKEKTEMNALDLKEQGNRLYSAKRYDDAIQSYTKAIVSTLSYSKSKIEIIWRKYPAGLIFGIWMIRLIIQIF